MEESTELSEYPFNINDIKDNQVNLEKETYDSLFVLNEDIKTESFTLGYFSNQNLENNQILDTQGVFLNESSFVQSGHLTGVQAEFNDSIINEHFSKENFVFYGSDVFYSLNQKAFIIDQLGFKLDTNKPLPTINIERITDDSRVLDMKRCLC